MSEVRVPGRPLGWPLLPLPDAAGGLSFPSLEESVRQQVKIILRTRPGEQLMHPEFGAGLDRLLHEPNTIATRRQIRDLIAQSLARWEPRLILERVDVDTDAATAATDVRVEIVYRLRRTGAIQQLGLDMKLGG